MKFKHIVLPATAAATLLTSTFFSSFAYGQKGASLTPASQWAITKVDESKAQGQSYCAMAQRFGQNTVLTIAQNSSNESSFALDFQSPILKSANSLNIVIDPGAGQQREYDIKPVSNSAFVVRLGRDPKFFEALQKTGYLRVEVGRDVYNFDLSDIDFGQDRLQGCLVSLIETASGPVSEPVQGQVKKSASFDSDINYLKLQEEVQTLRSENARLANKLRIQETSHTTDMEEASNLSLLVERLQKLRSENETLKEDLKQSKASIKTQSLDRDFAMELENLLAENTKLQTELSQKSEALENTNNLKDELDALRQENKALQSLAEFSQKDHQRNTQAFDSMLAELENENARLKQQLFERSDDSEVRALQALLDGLHTEKQSLEKRIEEHKNLQQAKDEALDLLKGRLDSLKAENLALQDQVLAAADQSQVSTLEQALARAEQNKALLETQLENAKNSQELNKEQIALLNSKIDRLESENAAFEKASSEAVDVDEFNQVREELVNVRSTKEQLESDLEKRNTIIREHEENLEALEEQLASLRGNNKTLSDRLANAHDKEAYVALDKQLKSTQQKKLELEEEILSLSEALTEKSSKVQQLEASLAIFQNKSIAAQNDLNETQEQREAIAQEIADLKAENSALLENYKKAQAEIAESALSHEEATLKLQEFETAKSDLIQKIEVLENERAERTEKIRILEEEVASFGQTEGRLNQELAAQKETAKAKDETIVALNEKINALNTQNAELQTKLQIALDDTELQQMENVLSTVKDENQSLQKLAQSNFEAIQKAQKLSEQVSSLEARNKMLEDEVQAMDQIVEDSQNFVKNMQDEFKDLMAQMEQKDQQLLKLSSLALERETLKAENNTLRLKLKNQDELQAEIAVLKTENKILVAQNNGDTSNTDLAELKKENQELRSMVNELSADDGQDSNSLLLAYQENEKLKQALEEQQSQLSDLEKLQQDFTALKEENAILTSRISEAPNALDQDGTAFEISALSQKLESQMQKNADLERKLKEKEAELTNSSLEISISKEPELKEAQQKIASLEEKLRRVQKQNQMDLQNLAQENVQLKRLVQGQDVSRPDPVRALPISYTPKPEQKPAAESPENIAPAREKNAQRDVLKTAQRSIDAEEGLRPQDIEPASGVEGHENFRTENSDAIIRVAEVREEEDFSERYGGFEAQRQEQQFMRNLKGPRAPDVAAQPLKQTPIAPSQREHTSARIPVLEDPQIESEGQRTQSIDMARPVENVPVATEPLERVQNIYRADVLLNDMLSQANIVDARQVQVVPHASNENKAAYQWQANNVFGSAEQNPLSERDQFESYVLSYLNKTQSRCPGDFAIVPDSSFDKGDVRVDTYEIACVGEGVNSSASLLFFNHGGTFTAVAHEASTEDMDQAISLRDRLIETITAQAPQRPSSIAGS